MAIGNVIRLFSIDQVVRLTIEKDRRNTQVAH